ncbi:protein yellow-like [Mytilus trossulus]|uniref:protein yellow-like n=1 Tax=Mytilus trossulus TaxID=6551 RepID=UPI003007F098
MANYLAFLFYFQAFGIFTALCSVKPNIVYEWETVDLVWPNSSVKDEYIQSKKFIPENNAINGIKMYKDSIYLTIPKLKDGVPFSLVKVQNDTSKNPLLSPYPNWDIHLEGDCSKMRLIQSMEIDPYTGYMWIIDTSFVPRASINIADQCPSKIIIWDLENDVEIHRHTFPSSVTGPGMFYLNDIVLDFNRNKTARWAYISDTLGHRLIVYDRELDISYAFSHPSMKPVQEYASITIGNVTNVYSPLGINGIAMSSDLKNVYYCPLAGVGLYRIPTALLRKSSSSDSDFSREVIHVGNKMFQSDGIYYGRKHNLYYSTLGPRSVYQWSMTPISDNVKPGRQTVIAQDDMIEWVDSFAFDESGYLWFVSNNLNTHFSNDTVKGSSNFFVWKLFVDDSSYLRFSDDTSSAASCSLDFFVCMLILLCSFNFW